MGGGGGKRQKRARISLFVPTLLATTVGSFMPILLYSYCKQKILGKKKKP